MRNDAFFNDLKSWSQRKHRLLGKYLSPFSAKVGSWAKQVYCIDGFAGAARYDDGSEGSPMLMARLADTCANWKKPVTLKIINVEAKKAHYNSLIQVTKSWTDKGVVTNKFGQFGSLVPEILKEIGNSPAFFFIDPYGPTKIPFRCLHPILTRQIHATEIIINFNVQGLRRLADCLHASKGDSTDARAINKIIAHVSEIMGSDAWKEYFFNNDLPSAERERKLLQQYITNLTKYDYNVVAYPIRATMKSSPKYFLIYCSRHDDGVILMNRFIREEEDQLLKEATTDSLQPRFDTDDFNESHQEVNQRRLLLTDKVLEYLQRMEKTTRKSIKRDLIYENFGSFHENDYTAVVQSLVDKGMLRTGHGRKRFNDNEPLTYVSNQKRGGNGN